MGVHVSLQNSNLYPMGKCLVVQLLGCRVILFLVFGGISILFSRVAAPAMQKRSSFSTSSPTSVVVWVVYFSHYDWCEILIYGLNHFFFSTFIYFWDRERQSMNGGGSEREEDTESEAGSRLWAVSTEPDTGLELTDREIMTWAEVGCFTYWATQVSQFNLLFYF